MSNAAIKKAFAALFGKEGIPKPEFVKDYAARLFREVVEAVDDGDDDSISQNDMYRFLVWKSPCGISQKTVDKFFDRLDLDKSGSISLLEFTKVITEATDMIRKDLVFNAKLEADGIPNNFVVAGSCRMNAASGTQAFSMTVLRRKDMKYLWSVFQEVDYDEKGTVDLSEFRKYLAKSSSPHMGKMAASIFYAIDCKRTGSVSFQKLLTRLYPEARRSDIQVMMRMARPKDFIPKGPRADQELLGELKSIFTVYDDDHSGSLDEEEFVHAMALAGFSEEESAEIFQEIDLDKSGEVSFVEFEMWYLQNARQIQATERLLENADRDSDAGD